ncbi:DUF3303 domain-containing protein [Methylococcus sp. EFPC2]|uniref:DUF3303 domain-containing protein n=1 Tax=Methylococcus sp. EFPC2 TaxID=2812648 RepID=UPI001967D557|nr:DUF3303 family protein [Methylococcus sp. EFPC2]QSA98431.1 DUF3303 family protein [Methylococcus sp. EFPC2]
MLFMVIEHFPNNDMVPIYQRLQERGRMLPEGLRYIDSWVEPNFSRCFQLMECDDASLLQQWVLQWRGSIVRFEFIPVVTSAQTQAIVAPHLGQARSAEPAWESASV